MRDSPLTESPVNYVQFLQRFRLKPKWDAPSAAASLQPAFCLITSDMFRRRAAALTLHFQKRVYRVARPDPFRSCETEMGLEVLSICPLNLGFIIEQEQMIWSGSVLPWYTWSWEKKQAQ